MARSSDPPTARVFFALWPTRTEREALAEWQAPLKQSHGGRAMRAETLHSTLVFLGDVQEARLERLRQAAREVQGERFELGFDAAHYWGHNHIVYAAPAHVPPQLTELAGALEQCLDQHGFTFDPREYRPHITLLRDARGAGAPPGPLQPVVWRIRDFMLMQSVPQGGSVNYRELARFPLGGPGG